MVRVKGNFSQGTRNEPPGDRCPSERAASCTCGHGAGVGSPLASLVANLVRNWWGGKESSGVGWEDSIEDLA